MTNICFYIAASLTLLGVIALMVLPLLVRPSPAAQRIMDVVISNRPDQRTVGKSEHVREALLKLARNLRGALGFTPNVKLKNRLLIAGFHQANAPDLFFAAQFLTPLAFAFAGSFMSVNTLFWVGTLAIVGYVAPDFWLTMRTRKRTNRIRRSIPDALDLLVICVDAGLGLDQALLRVVQELEQIHPDIHYELSQIQLEQRAGVPRLEAWKRLADRSKIEEFAAFVSMLMQTDRFGTPIVKALSRFADDIRLRRQQRAEEAAAKTKIKIIFPLVLFIFPSLFIVLLAPAILGIVSSLKGMAK